MHDVDHLQERHIRIMENLERQQRLAAEQRRREEERLELSFLRMRELLLQGEPPQRPVRQGFLRTLLPFI